MCLKPKQSLIKLKNKFYSNLFLSLITLILFQFNLFGQLIVGHLQNDSKNETLYYYGENCDLDTLDYSNINNIDLLKPKTLFPYKENKLLFLSQSFVSTSTPIAPDIENIRVFDTLTGVFDTLYDFKSSNSQLNTVFPTFWQMEGNYYGFSMKGGANDYGAIFKIDSLSGNLSTLYDFGDSSRVTSQLYVADEFIVFTVIEYDNNHQRHYEYLVKLDLNQGSLVEYVELNYYNNYYPPAPNVSNPLPNIIKRKDYFLLAGWGKKIEYSFDNNSTFTDILNNYSNYYQGSASYIHADTRSDSVFYLFETEIGNRVVIKKFSLSINGTINTLGGTSIYCNPSGHQYSVVQVDSVLLIDIRSNDNSYIAYDTDNSIISLKNLPDFYFDASYNNTGTMKVSSSKIFTKINDKFYSVFKWLYGGGSTFAAGLVSYTMDNNYEFKQVLNTYYANDYIQEFLPINTEEILLFTVNGIKKYNVISKSLSVIKRLPWGIDKRNYSPRASYINKQGIIHFTSADIFDYNAARGYSYSLNNPSTFNETNYFDGLWDYSDFYYLSDKYYEMVDGRVFLINSQASGLMEHNSNVDAFIYDRISSQIFIPNGPTYYLGDFSKLSDNSLILNYSRFNGSNSPYPSFPITYVYEYNINTNTYHKTDSAYNETSKNKWISNSSKL